MAQLFWGRAWDEDGVAHSFLDKNGRPGDTQEHIFRRIPAGGEPRPGDVVSVTAWPLAGVADIETEPKGGELAVEVKDLRIVRANDGKFRIVFNVHNLSDVSIQFNYAVGIIRE